MLGLEPNCPVFFIGVSLFGENVDDFFNVAALVKGTFPEPNVIFYAVSGAGGDTATKTEQAERLILDLLADGKELASEDIVKAAAEAGISERTVQNAKRNMGGILGARRVGGQWYNFIKKKQPPEPAS